MHLLQPTLIAALLVTGMGVAILGSIKLPLASRLGIDEAHIGGLVSLFGFVMIPVILTAGFLTDLAGKGIILISGSVFVAASLALMARARKYPAALLGVVLLSSGWALLINVGNVLIPIAFAAGGKQESLAYATNLANVVFGLGAFLTPMATALLVRWTALPGALSILAAFSLLPAALALGVDFEAIKPLPAATTASGSERGIGDLLVDPVMWLCALALFFYGPLEASMAAWTTTYLDGQGVRRHTAAALLSGFWLAFMATRLVTALTLSAGGETLLIFVMALAATAVLLGVVLSRGPTPAMLLVVAAGAVFGPIFPTLMAVLLGHVPSSSHGRAVGLFFAVGGLGWTTIPMLIGAYARKTSVQRGFVLAVGAAVGLCAIAWALLLIR